MAGLKEIKRRIKSVNNTRKITRAMKLVSAAKLRRAQDAVTNSRAYTDALNGLLTQLLAEQTRTEVHHPLTEERTDVRKITLVIAGGSRGLCGAFNTNINKKIDAFYAEQQTRGVEIEAIIFGRKPAEYFRRRNRGYAVSYETLPEDPNKWPIEEVAARIERDFVEGKTDEVHLIYTRFGSAISVTVESDPLLPMAPDKMLQEAATADDYIAGITLFEPGIEEVYAEVLPRILQSRIRQGCLDTKASEHGSRMTAMDAATKNAGDLSASLQRTHNKLRQTSITSEILDIVGGAEAIK